MKDSKLFIMILAGSFAWHIFWISLVDITVETNQPKSVRYGKISFLGPILDEKTLRVMMTNEERHLVKIIDTNLYAKDLTDPEVLPAKITNLKNTALTDVGFSRTDFRPIQDILDVRKSDITDN